MPAVTAELNPLLRGDRQAFEYAEATNRHLHACGFWLWNRAQRTERERLRSIIAAWSRA